ncbi:hypothetical protein ALC53_10448 [Atta colombica]|uniref:Uncharacterized protein n=1 Tax=Atta colombica TaxID=520822 RepID=A0A151I0Q7_9HYME|nr:hypothetical protein ALC53_10448 [Atta colombica]
MVVYEEEVIYPAKINQQSNGLSYSVKCSIYLLIYLSHDYDSPVYFSAAQTIDDFYVRPVTEWLRLRSV